MTLNADMREIELSIIVPVFNEADVLPELQRRLMATLETLNAPFEIIYVNDGSADGTLSLLEEMAAGDPRVKVLALSRNFGHQPALTAGCDHASGRALILMDGDLQDRPEAIPDFVRAWNFANHARAGLNIFQVRRHAFANTVGFGRRID